MARPTYPSPGNVLKRHTDIEEEFVFTEEDRKRVKVTLLDLHFHGYETRSKAA